jgi:hypothetical protein
MAKRFNHARVNLQKRIQSENDRWNREQIPASVFERPRRKQREKSSKWATFGLTQCRGKTAAWMFFEIVGTFQWMLRNDIPLKDLPSDPVQKNDRYKQFRDLKKVGYRAVHILLPPADRGQSDFAWICDSEDVFKKIVVVPKGQKIRLKHGGKVVMRTQQIDVSKVWDFCEPDVGLVRMVECLKRIFRLGPTNYEFFFDNDDNFDMARVRKKENRERVLAQAIGGSN